MSEKKPQRFCIEGHLMEGNNVIFHYVKKFGPNGEFKKWYVHRECRICTNNRARDSYRLKRAMQGKTTRKYQRRSQDGPNNSSEKIPTFHETRT